MVAKDITYNQVKEAIKIAFDKDEKLKLYYDPNVKVESIDEIISDVTRKVATYMSKVKWKGIYEGNNIIGYFVYTDKQLISFGLNIEYRQRKYLRSFFALIRTELGKGFCCWLHSVNIRGVRWLQKNGMIITKSNHLLTQLTCQ